MILRRLMWGLNPVFWFTRCFKTGDDLLQVLYKPEQAFIRLDLKPELWVNKSQFKRGAKKVLGEEGYGHLVYVDGNKVGATLKEYIESMDDDGDTELKFIVPRPEIDEELVEWDKEEAIDNVFDAISKKVSASSYCPGASDTLEEMLNLNTNQRYNKAMVLLERVEHRCGSCDRAGWVQMDGHCGRCGHMPESAKVVIEAKREVIAEAMATLGLETLESFDALQLGDIFQMQRKSARDKTKTIGSMIHEQINELERNDIIHDEEEW